VDISPLKLGFLLLNVVLENDDRCATATGSEVRRRPERAFPIASGQVGSFLSQHSAGYTLERVDQIGYSDLRRILDQQVDVVVFSVHLDKFSLKVRANPGEQYTKSVDGVSVKYSGSILCDEDQMDVHCEDAVCLPVEILTLCHRPSLDR